ncbi:hypothetical protein [Marinobacterium mangrovicola]|uniref:Uncharacterized protein n=1 Tax=Marinobacterium mangrovicola TaxID=1476959 RepID=A0A4R1GJC0_9GAMM|nr:hypothetical protein [Marinobacterium mangrovicola]TCK06069.1 hypothetical protein CLV83_3018 [Marinobacterium mangrovicola]
MTDQTLNGIQVNGIGYSVVSAEPGVFSPWDYGIEPESVCSSNWSGYVAGYEVVEDVLRLSSLSVGWSPPRKRPKSQQLAPDDPLRILDDWDPAPLPALNGVEPESIGGGYMHYADLAMPLDYSGRILGCSGDPDSPLPGECQVFTFESGRLVEIVESSWSGFLELL